MLVVTILILLLCVFKIQKTSLLCIDILRAYLSYYYYILLVFIAFDISLSSKKYSKVPIDPQRSKYSMLLK